MFLQLTQHWLLQESSEGTHSGAPVMPWEDQADDEKAFGTEVNKRLLSAMEKRSMRLDMILHSAALSVEEARVAMRGGNGAVTPSDHYAVVADLRLSTLSKL